MSLFVVLGAVGCYNPSYTSNPDANQGFRCFVTDYKPCPEGLVCCAGGLCDEELYQKDPNARGWCLPQQGPADLSLRSIDYWDFGTKPTSVAWTTPNPELTGKDDTGSWRCPRKLEPNDTPDEAWNVGLLSVIEANFPPLANYEICPAEGAETVPDIDVYRFRLNTPARVVAETRFIASKGDLDVAIFEEVAGEKPRLYATDNLGAGDSSCLTVQGLPQGKYFAVIRGAPSAAGPFNDAGAKYAMNSYQFRIMALSATASAPCSNTGAVDMR